MCLAKLNVSNESFRGKIIQRLTENRCRVVQLQVLRDSGQINDPRYKSIVAFLQAQQAQQAQGAGSTGGSSGAGPAGPLPPLSQQRLQQDGTARNSSDAQVSNSGNSDSSRGMQAHPQAAYLHHALLSAQQKVQANAYSQQMVSKPLQTGATRDHNNANNNLTLQVYSYSRSPESLACQQLSHRVEVQC